MRKKIVAGNWKMNLTYQEGIQLAGAIQAGHQVSKADRIILCAPFVHLAALGLQSDRPANLFIGAQNCHQEESGAYTGEVSAAMLKSLGVQYVILGHSERREYFSENNGLLAQKVNKALEHELDVIYCFGEKLESRNNGEHFDLVKNQISEGLFHLDETLFSRIILAYEPVWAIGTGVTASKEQAQEMHAFIRNLVSEKYGSAVAANTTILYGGSCNPKNAAELFAQPDVDGGLIGGASLKAQDFLAITASY